MKASYRSGEASNQLLVDFPVVDKTTVGTMDLDVARAGDQAGRGRDYGVVATVDRHDFGLCAQGAAKVLREGAAASRHVAVWI